MKEYLPAFRVHRPDKVSRTKARSHSCKTDKFRGTHLPQKYIMPLTLRRVRTTARRTWRHATRLDSISSVVTKMQANASSMLRYSSSMMI